MEGSSHKNRKERKAGEQRAIQPNPRRTYQRPYSEEGQWLSHDVLLRTIPTSRPDTVSHWPTPTSTTCIEAATQRSSEDSVVVELTCIQDQPDWNGLKWVHAQDPETSLDGFSRLIYSIPGISSEEMVLAERMLYDLRAKRTSAVTDFRSVAAGTTLRYDSRDELQHDDQEDRSVTFLSIPYFVTKKITDIPLRSSLGAHTLLESLYPYERSASRDRPQVYSRYAADSKAKLICTSQTLVLVFTHILVTYSDLPATTIGGSVLRFVRFDGSGRRPVLARIINPVGDIIHIDIDPVPPFFVFLEQVKLRCFRYEGADADQVQFFFDDDTEMDATSWLAKTESNSSAIITVRARLQLLQASLPPRYMSHRHRRDASRDRYEETYAVQATQQRQRRDENDYGARSRVRFEDFDFDSNDNTSHHNRARLLPWTSRPSTSPNGLDTSSQRYPGIPDSPNIRKRRKALHGIPKIRDHKPRPLQNDPNYRVSRLKPNIYHFPESALIAKQVKPQLMITSANGPDADSEAPKDIADMQMDKNYEWGFIWNGKSQSELRNVPAAPYVPIERISDSEDDVVDERETSGRTRLMLEWDEGNDDTSKQIILRSSNRPLSKQRQQSKALTAALEVPSDIGHIRNSLSHNVSPGGSPRSGSIDSSDRLALVPFKRRTSTSRIHDRGSRTAPGHFAIGYTKFEGKENELDRHLIKTASTDAVQEFDTDEFSNVRIPSWSSIEPPDTGTRFEYNPRREKRSDSYGLHNEEETHAYGIPYFNNGHLRVPRDGDIEPPYQPEVRTFLPRSVSRRSKMGARRRRATSQLRDAMERYVEDRRKLYIRKIPPFFAWGGSTTLRKDALVPDVNKLGFILRNIDEKLESGGGAQTRKMYRRAREMELRDLEASRPGMESTGNIYSPNHCLNTDGANLIFEALQKQTLADNGIDATDLSSLLNSVQDYTTRTVELFLPAVVKGKPLLKIWGSLHFYNQSLQGILKDEQHPNRSQNLQKWMVQDARRCEEISQSIPIGSPFEFIPDCWCTGQLFETREDAIEHLSERHYRKSKSPRFVRALLKYFVTTAVGLLTNRRLLDLLNPFQHFHSFLGEFHAQVEEIALGMASTDRNLPTKLQLTVSLVDSFEKYLLAHTKAVQLFDFVDRHYRNWLQGFEVDLPSYQSKLSRLDDELDEWCSSTLETAKKAYHETVILSRVETRISAIELNSVGLPSIIGGLLAAAQSTVFDSGEDIVTQYDACVAKLQYQVNQHPRKKLLHHIHHLEEELAAVRQTIEMSKILLRNYARTLRPESYRITTRLRETMNPVEEEYLKRTYRIANGQLRTLGHLERRSQHLAAQVKRSVEILEEDHGKAILIFTIITTIFLPLSFITSFFGMNTSDIRDMRGGQWLFWAAAVPFTTVIASVVLLMAFKGGDMLEAFGDLRWRMKQMFSSTGRAADLFMWRTPKRADTDITLESALKI